MQLVWLKYRAGCLLCSFGLGSRIAISQSLLVSFRRRFVPNWPLTKVLCKHTERPSIRPQSRQAAINQSDAIIHCTVTKKMQTTQSMQPVWFRRRFTLSAAQRPAAKWKMRRRLGDLSALTRPAAAINDRMMPDLHWMLIRRAPARPHVQKPSNRDSAPYLSARHVWNVAFCAAHSCFVYISSQKAGTDCKVQIWQLKQVRVRTMETELGEIYR